MLCRRLPLLPQTDAMPMLEVPPDEFMPEEAAPLAEPDTELDAEPDADEAGLYELWPPESDGSPHGFAADQLQQLYLQLSHHCQLMIEVYALAACNKDHQEAAVTVSSLLADYQVGAVCISGSIYQCCNAKRDDVVLLLMTVVDCSAVLSSAFGVVQQS